MNNLPTWNEINQKLADQKPLTPLEQFIYDWSPVLEDDEEELRADLAKLIEYVRLTDGCRVDHGDDAQR